MSFKRVFNVLLRKSDKTISRVEFKNGISIYNYDSSFMLYSSKEIINGSHRFIDGWFDIGTDDGIYGLINSKLGSLIYVYSLNNTLAKSNVLQFDPKKYAIKFPYIKKIDNTINILYYLITPSKPNSCTLYHYYYSNNKWHSTSICTLDYFILTNFVVTYENGIPSIFFLNRIKNYEELFVTTFDSLSKTWTTPYKITNTKKSKVYLSIIKDEHNTYHISYSENSENKYRCIYFNGLFKNNIFETNPNYIVFEETITCSFPTLLKYKSQLILQYIDNNELYSSTSSLSGEKWTNPNVNIKSSKNTFIRYDYKSNCKEDAQNIMPNYFSLETSLFPLF